MDMHSEQLDLLFDIILNLTDKEECYSFFEDLCTIKELQDMGQRIQVAMLLDKGLNYQEIRSRTGISSATISRVNRCLIYGNGGYKKAISNYEVDGNDAE